MQIFTYTSFNTCGRNESKRLRLRLTLKTMLSEQHDGTGHNKMGEPRMKTL
jgi:hypothetical protein